MSYLESFSSTLPIVFLVISGFLLRKLHFFGNNTVNDIKKLVVNVSLPLMLFNAFATMVFELRYLWIVASLFFGPVLLMFLSRKLGPIFGIQSRFFPFLMTGFEAGMMGYAIFSSIYGIENIPKFAIFDLGQVLFVVLVFIPTMGSIDQERTNLKQTLLSFIKMPVIIAIFSGLILNLGGLYPVLTGFPLTNAFVQTTTILGSVTIPMVALVLGYDLNLNLAAISKPLKTVVIRMTTWVVLGYLFTHFIVGQLLGLGEIYQAAAWILLIMPPPFVIPLFLTQSEESDRNYIANTLSLSTIISLFAVVIVRAFFPL